MVYPEKLFWTLLQQFPTDFNGTWRKSSARPCSSICRQSRKHRINTFGENPENPFPEPKFWRSPRPNCIYYFKVCVFMTMYWATLVSMWCEIMVLWKFNNIRSQNKNPNTLEGVTYIKLSNISKNLKISKIAKTLEAVTYIKISNISKNLKLSKIEKLKKSKKSIPKLWKHFYKNWKFLIQKCLKKSKIDQKCLNKFRIKMFWTNVHSNFIEKFESEFCERHLKNIIRLKNSNIFWIKNKKHQVFSDDCDYSRFFLFSTLRYVIRLTQHAYTCNIHHHNENTRDWEEREYILWWVV